MVQHLTFEIGQNNQNQLLCLQRGQNYAHFLGVTGTKNVVLSLFTAAMKGKLYHLVYKCNFRFD